MSDRNCTCNEPPFSGHFLWCEALRGRPEFRPNTKPCAVSQSSPPAASPSSEPTRCRR